MRRRQYRLVWYREGWTPESGPRKYSRIFAKRQAAEDRALILLGRGDEVYKARYNGQDGEGDAAGSWDEPPHRWWCNDSMCECESISDHHKRQWAKSFTKPLVGEPTIEERWAEYGPWEPAQDRR